MTEASALPPEASTLPPEAYAAALAGLPLMSPWRLRSLLRRRQPEAVWASVAGTAPLDPVLAAAAKTNAKLVPTLRAAARSRPPEAVWERCLRTGVAVHLLGQATYPAVLAVDREAPAVLFSRGDLAVLDGRRAAVIGTRNATATGRAIAHELGAGLAAASVRVVSGLARGIDGWAHRGVLTAAAAPPVGVVACGLDVVYPAEHRQLWHDVADHGLLLSEVPPGTTPEAFRFPLRNRILAALAELVVVVESRATGGSLVTVDAAVRRGIPVLAVPGSPRSPAAEGTNRLLVDGATPVLDVTDVLVALGLSTGRVAGPEVTLRPAPAPSDQAVLDVFAGEPLDLERVIAVSGRPMAEAALALARLEMAGWLVSTGGWFERAPGGSP
jgi:DNA processing protein